MKEPCLMLLTFTLAAKNTKKHIKNISRCIHYQWEGAMRELSNWIWGHLKWLLCLTALSPNIRTGYKQICFSGMFWFLRSWNCTLRCPWLSNRVLQVKIGSIINLNDVYPLSYASTARKNIYLICFFPCFRWLLWLRSLHWRRYYSLSYVKLKYLSTVPPQVRCAVFPYVSIIMECRETGTEYVLIC
jgi:hypothetical protein